MAYDPRGDHGAPGGGHEAGNFVRARGRREYFDNRLRFPSSHWCPSFEVFHI